MLSPAKLLALGLSGNSQTLCFLLDLQRFMVEHNNVLDLVYTVRSLVTQRRLYLSNEGNYLFI